MKVKIISLPYIFQALYDLCFTRPSYQVSVHRTNGPLVKVLRLESRHEKPAHCICENKDADQLHGDHAADQCLCFHYKDSTNLQLPKFYIQASSHLLRLLSSECVGPDRKPQDRWLIKSCRILFSVSVTLIIEPHHEKTCFLHMRKQRRRSAAP